jgi:hypothetical protein
MTKLTKRSHVTDSTEIVENEGMAVLDFKFCKILAKTFRNFPFIRLLTSFVGLHLLLTPRSRFSDVAREGTFQGMFILFPTRSVHAIHPCAFITEPRLLQDIIPSEPSMIAFATFLPAIDDVNLFPQRCLTVRTERQLLPAAPRLDWGSFQAEHVSG